MVNIITLAVLAALLFYAHRTGMTRVAAGQMFGGVCTGIAAHYPRHLNVPIVRVLVVLLALLTHGCGVLLYILLCLTLQKR